MKDAHRLAVHSKDVIENYPLQTYVSALVFSPSGSLIRTAFQHEEPNWITIKPAVSEAWSLCLHTFEQRCNAVAFSRDSNQLALAFYDGAIRIWDADSSTYLPELQGQESHSQSMYTVRFFHDSARLAARSEYDRMIKVWDVATGACLSTWNYASQRSEERVRFCNHKAIQDFEKSTGRDSIMIFDTAEDKLLSCLTSPYYGAKFHTDLPYHLTEFISTFSDSGRFLAVNFGTNIKIWDASSSRHIQTLEVPTSDNEAEPTVVTSACISDSMLLVLGFYSRTVMIFSIDSGNLLHVLHSGEKSKHDWVRTVAISPDMTRVASSSGSSSFKIWDLGNTSNPRTMDGTEGFIASLAFSPDSRRLVSRSTYGKTKIWDIYGKDCSQALDDHNAAVSSLAFGYGSKFLASGAHDSTVKIWDLHGKCLQTLHGHRARVIRVDILHYPARVGSLSRDNTYKIWDVVSGQCLHTYHCGHLEAVVVLSPDSRILARARGIFMGTFTTSKWPIELWDIVDDVRLPTLGNDLRQWIFSFAFSGDSTQLAVIDVDNIRIFQTRSGVCLQTLDWRNEQSKLPDLTLGQGYCSLAFSKDAKRLASAWRDGTIQLWDRHSSRCLQTIKTSNLLSNVLFDHSGQFLLTNFGRIAIPGSSDLQGSIAAPSICSLSVHGTWLSLDGKWLTYNSVNVLWLPPEYRPYLSAASEDSISVANGRKVWIFTLSPVLTEAFV